MNNTKAGILRVALRASLMLMVLAHVPAGVSSERETRNNIGLGALVFAENCQRCHQADGYGERALYPSLHDGDLLANRALLIQTILDGRSRHAADAPDGTAPLMPSLNYLTDKEVVSIIAFISNTWGDDVLIVSESEVAAARGKGGQR